MSELPRTVAQFDRHRAAFTEWLVANGSAVMVPTNAYEVARFLTDVGIGVVHRNERNAITSWGNGTDRAFLAFKRHQAWRACERGVRGNSKRRVLYNQIAARDGALCAYCGTELTIDTATIEHVLSVTHGGSSHMANLTLACRPCNREAGHLTARQKIEFALRKRHPEAAA